jgi:hypothetical protein
VPFTARSPHALRRWLLALAATSTLLLGLGACSDTGDSDETPTTTTPASPGVDDESDDEVPDTPDAGPDGEVDDRPAESTTTLPPGDGG